MTMWVALMQLMAVPTCMGKKRQKKSDFHKIGVAETKRTYLWPVPCCECSEYGFKLIQALALIIQDRPSELGLFHSVSEKTVQIARVRQSMSPNYHPG